MRTIIALVAAAAAAAQPGPQNFICDSGERITVSFEGARALLSDPIGATYRLRQQRAASGMAYAGQEQAISGKGDRLTWTPSGLSPRECHAIGVAEAAGPGFRLEGETLIHIESSMPFPATVAGFTRDDVRTYGDGEYVAVGYSRPIGSTRVHARISIIHIEGMAAREHYATLKPGILERLPGAHVLREEPFTLARMPGATGYRGVFTGTGRASGETVGLTAAGFGHWSARLRTIYPTAAAAQSEAALQTFVEALDWRLLATRPGASAAANPE